jgi:hypothetical protein
MRRNKLWGFQNLKGINTMDWRRENRIPDSGDIEA